MKRIFVFMFLFLTGLSVNAEIVDVEIQTNVTMANFFEKNGKNVQKINTVGAQILNANKINKRVIFIMDRTPKIINASAHFTDKSVHISSGILPYIDNDDELAAVLSHEIV